MNWSVALQMQLRRLVVLSPLVLLLGGVGMAQNLVPNPSFELKTSCPTTLGQIALAASWSGFGPQDTPDYYHYCALGTSGVSIPSNTFGNQTPRTGKAYAGFLARPSNPAREYVRTPLTSPLVAGVAYQVSFYVSLSDASQWAIDKLGAYLSVGPAPASNGYIIGVVPQIVNPIGNYINNKIGWTLVSGTYFALGGEDHLMIGNFVDDASTTPMTGLSGFYQGSYYFIDDVSVAKLQKQGKCDLVIGKSPARGSVPLVFGHQATFEITVTNQGTGACTSPISISDTFSAGLTYLSGGASGWVCPGGSIVGPSSFTCTNNLQLAPSQSSLLLVTFKVTAKPVIGNCARVHNGNDSNPANNKACIKLPVKNEDSPF
jgi:uncharacterized repeat protein (TIGR01451 family)